MLSSEWLVSLTADSCADASALPLSLALVTPNFEKSISGLPIPSMSGTSAFHSVPELRTIPVS